MKLRPERPTPAIIRSIRKAARAMYPVASIVRMKKNRIRICGRNTTTEPTPAMIPSVTRSRKRLSANWVFTPSPSAETPASSASANGVAQLNTAWNTTNSSANRMGAPSHGCSRSSSIRAWRR